MIMGFEALYAGHGSRNPVWSGKEAHWLLRGWTVKSAEHCAAGYKPLDRKTAYSTSGITSGKKVSCDLKMAAILKIYKY